MATLRLASNTALLLTLNEWSRLLGVPSISEMTKVFSSDDSISPKTIQRAITGQDISAESIPKVKDALKTSMQKMLDRCIGEPPISPRAVPLAKALNRIVGRARMKFDRSPQNDCSRIDDCVGLSGEALVIAAFPHVLRANLCTVAAFDAMLTCVPVVEYPQGHPSLFLDLFPHPDKCAKLQMPLWWWMHEVRHCLRMEDKGFSSVKFATLLRVDNKQPNRWMRARKLTHLPAWPSLAAIQQGMTEELTRQGRDPDLAITVMMQGLAARALHGMTLHCERVGLSAQVMVDLQPWYAQIYKDWCEFILASLRTGKKPGKSPFEELFPETQPN